MFRHSDAKSTNKLLRFARILFPLCALCTVVFILFNSSLEGMESGSRSAMVTAVVNDVAEQLGQTEPVTEHQVRKAAHFSEYALLGFWLMLTLRAYTRRVAAFLAWPLLGGLLTAVLDENYQLLIPGRTGHVFDVLIDFSGLLTGLLVGFAAVLLAKFIHRAVAARHESSRPHKVHPSGKSYDT